MVTVDIPVDIGVYTVPEAARYIRVDVTTVRRWIKGYTFAKRDGGKGRSARVLEGELPRVAGRTAISFCDLIELLFVRTFRRQGVTLPVIRKAAKEAQRRWGIDHPFCVKQFATDGRTIFATLQDVPEDEALLELTKSQLHFATVINPYLKQMDFTDIGDVGRWWPLGKSRGVFLDPRISFGKPVTVGRAVPTNTVYQAVLVNKSHKEVADWYGIPVSAVRAAVEFEESRAA